MREMSSLKASSIATAHAGYVALKGTLELAPNTDAITGPYTKLRGVWYDLESRWSNTKTSRTYFERSAQLFVLRDATGNAIIDPKNMTVRTRHVSASWTYGSGMTIGKRSSERLLKVGDSAYVIGELTIIPTASDVDTRTVHASPTGRRFFVSNFSEEALMSMERAWFIVGAFVFTLSVLVLAWSFYQRYHGATFPGTLL